MKYIIALACLLTSCTTKKTQELEGKLLKDRDGRYYVVTPNVGDTVFLKEIDLDTVLKKYAKF